MRILRWCAVGLLIALCGCARATLNVGNGTGGPPPLTMSVSLSPAQPAGGYVAGDAVTATITFFGSPPPFHFTLSFPNGGASPATQMVEGRLLGYGGTATATFVVDSFFLVEDPDGRDIHMAIMGTNGSGYIDQYSTTLHVVGIPCQPAVFDGVTVSGTTVTLTVSNPDGEDVTVTWTATGGFSGMPESATITGGNGTATFTFAAPDLLAGGGSDITFTAWDDCGWDTETLTLWWDPLTLAADTLYAIPLQTIVNAGEPVRIVVASGDPANPFFYMTGVRVTVDPGADALYVGGDQNHGGTADVPGSFNIGAVGGETAESDGIWVDQGATSFLLPPDNFHRRNLAASGLHAFDFNITPLDGSDMATGEGELFNFELVFQNPGTWTLGFEAIDIVNKTYYQDSNLAPDYFWGDISNDHPGIPNAVTVE